MSVVPTFIGVVGDTGVYRVPLSSLGLTQLRSLNIIDSGQLGIGVGAATGTDLDFVKISDVFTNDPSAAAGLGSVVPFSFENLVFRAGYLAPVPTGAAPELKTHTLFGATPGNQNVDHSIATLDVRDALTVSPTGGAVSLGAGGSIAFRFDLPFDPQGLFLYFGDVAGNEASFVSGSATSALSLPARPTIRGTEVPDDIRLDTPANAHLLSVGVAINGGGGDDRIIGGNGNDRLAGSGGNDIAGGGLGFDTALFRGPRSEYSIANGNDGWRYVLDNIAGRDGTTLIAPDVENLQFANVPTFRFFHTQAGGHLFTTSAVEAASVRANLPHYRDEGQTFLTADEGFAGAVPVFRFFHTQAGGHLFTTSAVEAASVRANLPHYRDEGVGFHMAAAPGEDLVPIFRFFHTLAGGHLFTSSEVEAASVRANLPHYRDEGIAFYAPTRVADELFG